MSDDQFWFEGLSLPIWIGVDPAIAELHGTTAATHVLSGEGNRVIPLFTSEEKARQHLADHGLKRHEVQEIDDGSDFRITLEQFRSRGGTHVVIDPIFGGEDILFQLDKFISMLD